MHLFPLWERRARHPAAALQGAPAHLPRYTLHLGDSTEDARRWTWASSTTLSSTSTPDQIPSTSCRPVRQGERNNTRRCAAEDAGAQERVEKDDLEEQKAAEKACRRNRAQRGETKKDAELVLYEFISCWCASPLAVQPDVRLLAKSRAVPVPPRSEGPQRGHPAQREAGPGRSAEADAGRGAARRLNEYGRSRGNNRSPPTTRRRT